MIRSPEVFDRYLPAQFDGVFLWDFLKGAFGPTIEPMDFDGVVERRGSFLVFETKAPGVPVPDGQRITLETLLRDRRFVVILCAKDPRHINGWDVWHRSKRTHMNGDAAALKAWCAAWYEHKNDNDPIW